MEIEVDELMQLEAFQTVIDADPRFEPAFSWDDVEAESEEEEDCKSQIIRNALNDEEKKQLVMELFSHSLDGLSLRRGIMKEIGNKYKVSRFVVSRLWNAAVKQRKNGEVIVIKNGRSNCGRKAKHTTDETLKFVPLKHRTTMRSFAKALDVSVATVHRLAKKGIIRSHSNSIKPTLTAKHKKSKMQFIVRFIIPSTVNVLHRFDMLYNMVHIDEKWFFMTKTTQIFYLFSEEDDPYRTTQSKGFITKVMFLAGLARPRIGETGEVNWDGKIGIFPFTEEVAAIRGSANRPRGTLETKPIKNINQDTVRDMVIDILLPKIRERWPVDGSKQIWIQQDNARPHIRPNDPKFLIASTLDGFDMRLIQQPAQSPDLNILDLGFFRSIQALEHQAFPDTVSSLILSVKEAFAKYCPLEINYTWLSLMLR